MRYFLLFLLLSLPAFGANVTFRLSQTSVQVSAPATPTGGGYIYSKLLVNGVSNGGIGVATPIASGQTVTINISAQTKTADETAKVRAVLFYDPNAAGAANKDVFWLQFDKNNPPLNPGGPVNNDGVPTNPAGDPVDDDGKPIVAPPKRHYASVSYSNNNPFPVTLQIIYTCSIDGLMFQKAANVEAGSAYFTDGYHDHPFTITAQPMADGNPLGDPISGPSEPVDENDPGLPPLPNPGEPGGVGGPPSTGGGPRPGNGQVGAPDPTPDQPRPGTGEGNADARNKELRGELQRIAAQLNSGFNQAANDADRTNDLLNDIKSNTGKTADNTEGDGEGDGEGEGNGNGSEIPGAGSGPDGTMSDSSGIGGKLQSVRDGAASLQASAQGLVSSLGLSAGYSQSTLTWSIPFPPFGTVELNFEALLGQWIGIIRQVLVFFISLNFLNRILAMVKGVVA